MSPTLYIFLVINIILIVILYFVNNFLFKKINYQVFIKLMTAYATVVLALGVGIQIITYNIQKANEKIKIIDLFRNNYIINIIELFMKYPEMEYFYNELVLNKIDKNAKRNITLENQICLIIIIKTIEQINSFNIYKNLGKKDETKKVLINFISQFFKSPIFRNYYYNIYLKNISNTQLNEFINKYISS